MVYYTEDDDYQNQNEYGGTHLTSYHYPTYELADDDFEFETEPAECNVSRIPRLETIPEIVEEPDICSLSSADEEAPHRDSNCSLDIDAARCERVESVSTCEHLPSFVAANSDNGFLENDAPETQHTRQTNSGCGKWGQSRENTRTVSDFLDSLSDDDDEDDPNAMTLPKTQLPGFERIGARVAGKMLPDALENGHCKCPSQRNCYSTFRMSRPFFHA